MAGANTQIIANDYNAIQSKIANVLGVGSQDFGYGQVVQSSQVARDIKITVDQWNALRNDLLKARQHQTGINEGSNLITPTNSTTIKEIDSYVQDPKYYQLNNEYSKIQGLRKTFLDVNKTGSSQSIVVIDDKYGHKGACWRYAVKARCEHEAIELTKKQCPKLKDYCIDAFQPKYKAKEKIGKLIYYDGDPRL
mgnify:CR=1 FL=1